MRNTLLVLCWIAAGCSHHHASVVATDSPAGSSLAPATDFVEYVVPPNEADPVADKWLRDEYAVIDPRVPRLGVLVVYLVGSNGGPANVRRPLIELAAMGFHTLAPTYPNTYKSDICAADKDPDPDCHRKVRLEALESGDPSPHLEVTRANCAEERVARLLAHLHRLHPEQGWGAYLDGNRPAWDKIIIAGHSHGAATAGFIGKFRRVLRVVMLSGPGDTRGGEAAAWTKLPPATPLDRFYGLTHVREGAHKAHLAAWEAMGLGKLGAPVAVDDAVPPFSDSHQLTTALQTSDDPHGVTAASSSSPMLPDGSFRLGPVWRYLFGRPSAAAGEKPADGGNLGGTLWKMVSADGVPDGRVIQFVRRGQSYLGNLVELGARLQNIGSVQRGMLIFRLQAKGPHEYAGTYKYVDAAGNLSERQVILSVNGDKLTWNQPAAIWERVPR